MDGRDVMLNLSCESQGANHFLKIACIQAEIEAVYSSQRHPVFLVPIGKRGGGDNCPPSLSFPSPNGNVINGLRRVSIIFGFVSLFGVPQGFSMGV